MTNPPPYHLRTNKAVDRFMFAEAIRRLIPAEDCGRYTYYSLGGPFLEDFRIFHEQFPDMNLVSFEEMEFVYKRQIFHRPAKSLKLKKIPLRSFLNQYDPRDKRSIFWLDYTKATYSEYSEFMLLLGKVTPGSIIKITLRCEPRDYNNKPQNQKQFRDMFDDILPTQGVAIPRRLEDLAKLLQDMIRIAAQKTLSSATEFRFQPISSFCYQDGAGMFTLTGIKCKKADKNSLKNRISKWAFSNLFWAKPKRIDVPYLTTKERLHLQEHLPCVQDTGRALIRALGYKIDEDSATASVQMKQYAEFYRQYPYFVRTFP